MSVARGAVASVASEGGRCISSKSRRRSTYSPIAGLKIKNSHVGVGLRLSVPFTVFPWTFADRPGQDHPG